MPYRSRFYQAIMDSQSLHSGADYEELKDLYIIFIQPFDIFRKNRRIYTMRTTCIEEPNLDYNNGVTWVYLNASGKVGGSEELAALLNYMVDSTEKNATTTSLKKLNQWVIKIKNQKKVGERYMFQFVYERDIRERAISEGLREGRPRIGTKKTNLFLKKRMTKLVFLYKTNKLARKGIRWS